MSKELPLIEIDGFWLDDMDNPFKGYLVKQTQDVSEENDEDDIFYYGLTEEEIQKTLGKKTAEEFVITAYRLQEFAD